MANLANGGLEDDPAAKLTRLESVIPVPAPARKKEAAKGQPTPPPRPCPPPLWLSGQLPPTQRGRGAGSQNSSHRGGGPAGAARAAPIAAPAAATEDPWEAASEAAGAVGETVVPTWDELFPLYISVKTFYYDKKVRVKKILFGFKFQHCTAVKSLQQRKLSIVLHQLVIL